MWENFVQGVALSLRFDTMGMMGLGLLAGMLVGALPGSALLGTAVSGFYRDQQRPDRNDVVWRTTESQDRAGFVVNALLIPYILSAIRMMESGFASADDIDAGMVLGCNHPMGPLALADLIGLDTTMAVAESLYEEFKEQLYATPPLLNRMCDAGLLGRKSGRGFYTYDR